MTTPKGVRVTVERCVEDGQSWRDSAFCWVYPCGRIDDGTEACYSKLRKAGVPPLKPGESVTGRMVFVPDKPRRVK